METPGIISLIPQIAQMAYGAWQFGQGRKMSRENVPDYDIPNEYGSMLRTQRASMLGDMPGSSAIRQDIRGNTADYLDTASRYGTLDSNSAGAAYSQEQGALSNLGVQTAMYRTGEKDKYLNTLDMMGQQKLQKQNWEEFNPYNQRMQTASAMMGAGTQNIGGSISGAADFFGNRNMMEQMGYGTNPMFGGGNDDRYSQIRQNAQTNPLFAPAQKQAFSNMFGNSLGQRPPMF